MRETATSSSPHTVSPLVSGARIILLLLSESVLHLQLCTLPFPPCHPFTPFSLAPLLCPPFLFFLPAFKAHALLSALAMWSGRRKREQNNGRLSVSQPSTGGGKGGPLAASIFPTVNSNRLIPASLLLARLASMVEWTKWKQHCRVVCLFIFISVENRCGGWDFTKRRSYWEKAREPIRPFTYFLWLCQIKQRNCKQRHAMSAIKGRHHMQVRRR